MRLYANPHRPDHAENNERFLRLIRQYPQIQPYQPSPDKAPWHVQAVIDGESPQLINFWPHVLKGQREGYRSVEGVAALEGIIRGAIEDASEDDYSVIEE